MPNVILVTVDALRYDHFTKDHFPMLFKNHIKDFAIFDNCLSNGSATPLSFPAIHTGFPVQGNGVLPQDKPTIAELITGHTKAIPNNTHLSVQRGYSRGFIDFDNKLGSKYDRIKWKLRKLPLAQSMYEMFWNNIPNREAFNKITPLKYNDAEIILNDLFLSIEGGDGFYWAHLLEPHAPYTPRKIGDHIETDWNIKRITHANRKIVNESRRNMGLGLKHSGLYDLEEITCEDIEICREMYGHMIRYVDSKLSKFISRLKKKRHYDDDIVIILSDHGEAFGEEGVFTHDWTANPIDVLLRIPLIVKFPHNNITETFGHLVQSADIVATLIELLGLDAKRPIRTHKLTNDRDRIVISKSNTAIRVTTPDAVAIRRGDGITESRGDLPGKCGDILCSEKIPNVASLEGVVPKGGGEMVLKQLEYLGYI